MTLREIRQAIAQVEKQDVECRIEDVLNIIAMHEAAKRKEVLLMEDFQRNGLNEEVSIAFEEMRKLRRDVVEYFG